MHIGVPVLRVDGELVDGDWYCATHGRRVVAMLTGDTSADDA